MQIKNKKQLIYTSTQIKILKLCFVVKRFSFLSGFKTRTDKSISLFRANVADASVTKRICRLVAWKLWSLNKLGVPVLNAIL